MTEAQFISNLPANVVEDLRASGKLEDVFKAYRESPDNKGCRRLEVHSTPLPGSKRYPYLKRPRSVER